MLCVVAGSKQEANSMLLLKPEAFVDACSLNCRERLNVDGRNENAPEMEHL